MQTFAALRFLFAACLLSFLFIVLSLTVIIFHSTFRSRFVPLPAYLFNSIINALRNTQCQPLAVLRLPMLLQDEVHLVTWWQWQCLFFFFFSLSPLLHCLYREQTVTYKCALGVQSLNNEHQMSEVISIKKHLQMTLMQKCVFINY